MFQYFGTYDIIRRYTIDDFEVSGATDEIFVGAHVRLWTRITA